MLGSIEELEKEIEQFKSNVTSSGEIVSLLKKLLKEVEDQSTEFNSKSLALLNDIGSIPHTIEEANENSNKTITRSVEASLQEALTAFASEQDRYMKTLEQMKMQIQSFISQSEAREERFKDAAKTLVERVEAVPDIIIKDSISTAEKIKADTEAVLSESNEKAALEQSKYIAEMKIVSEKMNSCESQIEAKYKEFIQSLENTNLTNIHEQIKQLNLKLNNRTTMLMIIAGLSLVVGIIGIIM